MSQVTLLVGGWGANPGTPLGSYAPGTTLSVQVIYNWVKLAPSSRDYNTKVSNSHDTTPLRTHDKTAALYIIHSPLTWAPVFLLLRFTGATHRRSQNVEPHL